MLGRFVHKLTRDRQESPPNECRGGLLADEMGLGKSLSLLALIVHTLEEARRFTTASDATCADQLPRMGATLIVTPYSSEISKSLWRGILTTYSFAKLARRNLEVRSSSFQENDGIINLFLGIYMRVFCASTFITARRNLYCVQSSKLLRLYLPRMRPSLSDQGPLSVILVNFHGFASYSTKHTGSATHPHKSSEPCMSSRHKRDGA
jgi:hypothetical protein